MWIADGWKDQEGFDTSSGEKLERWADYILVRPDPQVIWETPHNAPEWKKKNGHYHRSNKGGGQWEFFNLPEQWQVTYDLKHLPERKNTLRFNLKPFSFKHTGLFPEQAVNWDWCSGKIAAAKEKNPGREIKVLNLFAYTGGATVACAKAGAAVTHVDASKGMVTWAKENAYESGLAEASIRYLVDDYGLNYYAAFSGCSAESEASFKTVTFLAGKVDELGVKSVLTMEKSDDRIAQTVIENTKAKDQKILQLNSMQSITSEEIADGATYLSVMEDNLGVLKEALN